MAPLRKTGLISIAVACISAASTLLAADDRALYLGFSGGTNVPTTNAEVRRDTDQTPDEIYENFDYNLDYGYSLSASLGTHIRDFRVEFQCAAQRNTIDSIESLGVKSDSSASLTAMQFMGNLLYDVPISKHVTGFLGAGAGVAQVWLRPDKDASHLGNQDGMGFAYQGIAGIAWEIGPGVSITADYRVWKASEIDMQDVRMKLPIFHMVEVGVRFSF